MIILMPYLRKWNFSRLPEQVKIIIIQDSLRTVHACLDSWRSQVPCTSCRCELSRSLHSNCGTVQLLCRRLPQGLCQWPVHDRRHVYQSAIQSLISLSERSVDARSIEACWVGSCTLVCSSSWLSWCPCQVHWRLLRAHATQATCLFCSRCSCWVAWYKVLHLSCDPFYCGSSGIFHAAAVAVCECVHGCLSCPELEAIVASWSSTSRWFNNSENPTLTIVSRQRGKQI